MRSFPGEIGAGEARMFAHGWTVGVVREGLQALAADDGLDPSGLQDADVWRWLRGEVYPRESLTRLCQLFRCDQGRLGWPARGIEEAVSFAADDAGGTLVQAWPTMPMASPTTGWDLDSPAADALHDWPHWFALALTQLLGLIDQSYGEPLQRLLHQEMLMFDAVRPAPDEDRGYDSSRRQLLITLLALPVALTAPMRLASSSAARTEEALARCAASIAAAWQLLQESDFAIVEQHLSGYLLWLTAVARRPSSQQVEAARLASQAYRAMGIVALHRRLIGLKNYCSQQAILYAGIANDPDMQAATLLTLAEDALLYPAEPDLARAADSLGRARLLERDIGTLVRARLRVATGLRLAVAGEEQSSIQELRLGEDGWTARPADDPGHSLHAFPAGHLALMGGLTHLALARRFPDRHHQEQAWDTFETGGRLAAEGVISERTRVEIVNHQAATAIEMDDMDRFATYLRLGVEGARGLRSVQRLHEAASIWRRGIAAWPGERRVIALAELFPDQPGLPAH